MFEVSYIIINLFQTYIIFFAYSKTLGKYKTGKFICFLSFLSYFVVISMAYLLFNNPIINVTCNIILFFVITLNYNAAMKKRIIVSLSFFAFFATVEGFVVMVYNVLELSPHSRTEGISILWGMVIARIVTFILCGIVLRRFDVRQNSRMSTKQLFSISIVSIGILILTYVLITIRYESMVLALVSIIVLCGICIFVFNFINVSSRIQLEEEQRKLLEMKSKSYLNEIKVVNKAQNEIRYLKHDMLNHLNTIQALINSGNYLKIQAYIKNVAGILKNVEKVSNTNIAELDSIINFKISLAKERGIKVNANIRIEKEIKIKPQDYISIIANLFDNAIEAAAKVDSDNKYISFSIGVVTSLLVIRIENPYCHKIINRAGNLMTTKPNKKQHGYGLLNVHALVEKYDGTINISYDNKFIVEISIFNTEIVSLHFHLNSLRV